ncbi:hypothetical protein Nepgr_026916 [Nepenthes gracilis]|uniref:Uncharacterized protein n=1 Tax=Nepenthes gracilis TaxID=150966 RepID=A0AAD3T9H2_NEPGR|nr:hypothetical protein Nepgr_026916 [Nepenthes gracilis]
MFVGKLISVPSCALRPFSLKSSILKQVVSGLLHLWEPGTFPVVVCNIHLGCTMAWAVWTTHRAFLKIIRPRVDLLQVIRKGFFINDYQISAL